MTQREHSATSFLSHGPHLLVRAMLALWVALAVALCGAAAQVAFADESAGDGAGGAAAAASAGGGAGTGAGDGSGGGGGGEGVTLAEVQFAASGDSARIYDVLNGDFSNVHPKPMGSFPYVYLLFDKNVSYARTGEDASFVKENLAKVHLRYADGRDVPGARAGSLASSDSRRVIGIYTADWLDPLTDYQIVVEPGVAAANGRDVTTEQYVVDFRTGPECSDGTTVYERTALILFGLALGGGVAVAIVRRVRATR